MPNYIILGKFTQEGITSIKESPKRLEGAKGLAKSLGGEIKQFYYTMGTYDFVAIIEAPDNETMMKSLLIQGSTGTIRTETLVAFPEDITTEIIKSLP